MKKSALYSILFILCILSFKSKAQSRVFKQVNEGIETKVVDIRQDNQLVGYLVFTQLEKISMDSGNYRITILDENLNDIGVVNFRDLNLELQAVSLEGEQICLVYLRSGMENGTSTAITVDQYEDLSKKYKKESGIYIQYINLEGKITNSLLIPEESQVKDWLSTKKRIYMRKNLPHAIQLKNVPDKGFTIFYGIPEKRKLCFIDNSCKIAWDVNVKKYDDYVLETANTGVHLLCASYGLKSKFELNSYNSEVLSYDFEEGKSLKPIPLKDNKQNKFRILAFSKNPVTNQLIINGLIYNSEKKYMPISARSHFKGPYLGAFSIEINQMEKNGFKSKYSYWLDDKNLGYFDRKGRIIELKAYPYFHSSFNDNAGNDYFATTLMKRKIRFGAVAFGVLGSPLLLPTVVMFMRQVIPKP